MFNIEPPSEEELEKFKKYKESRPSPVIAKSKEEEESQTTSDLKDLLLGGGQGATLGFGDEILAAIQATVSPSQKSWLESYREKQKENEAAYKEAQERSPWLTGIGELAGGFALPVGTLLKGAKAGAEGAKLAGMALGGVESAKKAERAYNVLQAAKTGAAVGGIAGLGTSEGTIEESPGQLVSDIASGVTFGGTLGAVGSKVGQGLAAFAEENPNIQRALRTFNLEKEGVNLGTETGQKTVNTTVTNTVDDTTNSLLKSWDAVSQDLNEKIAKYGNATPSSLFESFRLNPNSSGAQLRHILRNNRSLNIAYPEFEDLRRAAMNVKLEKYQTDPLTRQQVPVGPLNISDLLNLRDEIRSSFNKLRSDNRQLFKDPVELEEIKRLPKLIDETIKAIGPDGEDIMKAYQTKAKMAYPIEALLNDTADEAAHSKKIYTLMKNPNDLQQRQKLVNELSKAIRANIRYSSGTGSSVVDNKEFLKDVTRQFDARLKEAIKTSPILEDAYLHDEFLSPDKILNKWENAYKDLGAMEASEGIRRMSEKTSGEEAIKAAATGAVGVPISFSEGSIATVGGQLGRLESSLGKPVTKARDLIKTYGVDKLKSIADTLRKSNMPVAKQLGESAMASLDNGDAASRAAFMNSIMQNPDLRKMLDLNLNDNE